jgi:hypothetical protein
MKRRTASNSARLVTHTSIIQAPARSSPRGAPARTPWQPDSSMRWLDDSPGGLRRANPGELLARQSVHVPRM